MSYHLSKSRSLCQSSPSAGSKSAVDSCGTGSTVIGDANGATRTGNLREVPASGSPAFTQLRIEIPTPLLRGATNLSVPSHALCGTSCVAATSVTSTMEQSKRAHGVIAFSDTASYVFDASSLSATHTSSTASLSQNSLSATHSYASSTVATCAIDTRGLRAAYDALVKDMKTAIKEYFKNVGRLQVDVM